MSNRDLAGTGLGRSGFARARREQVREELAEIRQLQSDIIAALRRTRSEVIADLTKIDGFLPWRVERQGDTTMAWGTTGRLEIGGTATLYLTENREVGGESLFRNAPMFNVTQDGIGDIGGVAFASGPEKPSASFKVQKDYSKDYLVELAWVPVPGNEVWSIMVTNNTGVVTDFLVQVWGV
jgi:hypothetical protein